MQLDAVETVLVGRLGRNGHFFDGVGVVVTTTGARQRNLRRVGLAGLDEKILADANSLALLHAGDVVHAVLFHLDGAAIDVVLTARELDLFAAVELDLAALKRAIGGDFELSLGAEDGAQIAAALLDVDGQAGPGGVMIGDANLFHRGQVGDANFEVLRLHRAGGDVILDVLRQAAKQILIAAREITGGLGQHRDLFPLGRTLKVRMHRDARRTQADGNRGNDLVGVAAHNGIAGRDAQVVERGLIAVRTGPQQRSAVAEETRTGSDDPDQEREGAGGGSERDPQTAVSDELRRLGGLGDIEGIAGQEFDERIVALTFLKSGEALLELREGGFGGLDGAASREASQRHDESGGSGNGKNQDQRETGGGDASVREGESVGDGDQHQGRDQRAAGENGQTAEPGAPSQTLFQLRDVGVKLCAGVHGASSGTADVDI